MQQIEVGQMVFLRDGEVGVGAVREVRSNGAELVINIENGGDFTVATSVVRDVHSGKVMLDVEQLPKQCATRCANRTRTNCPPAPMRPAIRRMARSSKRAYQLGDLETSAWRRRFRQRHALFVYSGSRKLRGAACDAVSVPSNGRSASSLSCTPESLRLNASRSRYPSLWPASA